MNNVTHKFPSTYLFLFLTLYLFRAHRAHHQERQIVSIQPMVTVTLCWWPCRVQVGSSPPTCKRHSHRQLPEVVLTQFVFPTDEHDVLETRRVKNKYLERNFCVTLVIYQESLYDAWSTKCKNKERCVVCFDSSINLEVIDNIYFKNV
jgi:hypothetical protein